ncbi:MAG TPA: DUF4340 domain-containing protein [Vicinamibacterales bacterium]|jgi:hypothetical protein
MRGLRSFIILLVVAIPLGWYAWHESKTEPAPDQKPQEKVFAGLQSDKIAQVTIKSDKDQTTTEARQGTSWQETQPAPAPADQAEISGITANLASLSLDRVIDEKPSDLKQYGLNPARVEVSFKDGGSHALLIGNKTPTGTDLYAKLPDKPRVFLIPSYLDATFNKSPFDLRDKSVLKVEQDKVDHIDIATADQTITLVKQGEDWKLTTPFAARADFSAVEGVLSGVAAAQMKSIVSDTGADLKEYGLDAPALTVHLDAGSSQAGLAIGKTAGEGSLYAKDLSRPMVFTIDSTVADSLKKSPGDFRVKDLFDARSFNTTHVEIVRGGTTMTFDKQNDAWKETAPAQKTVDAAKMDALVSALTNTRANSFVDKTTDTGLDTPELTATLKYDEGKQDRVLFAHHGADVFAKRDGDPGAAKVDSSSFDAITKALDALK